jgi:cobalt-zinc-cadmium efflux system protein
VLVAVTNSVTADPVVSVLIAGFILWSTFGVLRESATVLLEGTPPGTDMPGVIRAIKAVAGVLDVHDLHVWMVGPGVVACSCHIVVAEQSIRQGQQVVRAVARSMENRFHITHTTVQVEVEGCDPNELYCVPRHVHGRAGTLWS